MGVEDVRVVSVPVSDQRRAKEFYAIGVRTGWRGNSESAGRNIVIGWLTHSLSL